MRLRTALLMGSILALPLAARAQVVSGPYVSGGLGANYLQDESVKSVDIGGTHLNLGKTKVRNNIGGRATVAAGYGFGNGLRVELEGDYFINGVDKIGRNTNGGLGSTFQTFAYKAKGQEQKYGGFVNALYDFDGQALGLSSTPWPVTPYVGLGAGYLQAIDHRVDLTPVPGSGNSFLLRDRGTAGNFAYQAILGAALPISYVPGLALTLEYRFTGMADNRSFKGQYFAPGLTTSSRVHEAEDYNHSVMLGVRYAFNAAPPPPPPAPVPVAAPATAPSRSYLVFFDWDRADLTARARQIIADAAQNASRVQYTRIEVDGNADKSGTPAYNQKLSLRRAQNVASELVRDGVPQGVIDIQAFGDTRPLVPTAAGVREPQNRRVEIILR